MLHYRTTNHHVIAPRTAPVTMTSPTPFISSAFAFTMVVSVAIIVPARAVCAVRIIDIGIISSGRKPILLPICLPPTDCVDA